MRVLKLRTRINRITRITTGSAQNTEADICSLHVLPYYSFYYRSCYRITRVTTGGVTVLVVLLQVFPLVTGVSYRSSSLLVK